MGTQLPPSQKGGGGRKFSEHVYCGQTAGWIKMPLGTEVGLGPGDIVLDGTQLPQKGGTLKFSAHVYCGQTAVCMRIPFDMEVSLSLGDIVLDRDPAPPRERSKAAPVFSAHVYCGDGRPSQLLLSSCSRNNNSS